jgi:hypothetical protein
MPEYGLGFPLEADNLNRLYGFEQPKTNGFLMRNSDGRIPAVQLPIGRLVVSGASVLYIDGAVPWGNGLWRDISTVDTSPGAVYTAKPAKSRFIGILKFNQGWQAGHPIAPWGLPAYSKGTVVNKGFVGYKHAMAAVGQESNYLAYLKGDKTKDDVAVRTTYDEWMAAFKAGAEGSRLGLFFANDSGFPLVSVVANPAAPTLANATFAGFALDEYQKEHKAVYFDIG